MEVLERHRPSLAHLRLMLVEVVAGSAHQLGLPGLAVRAEAEQASKELE